MLCHIALGLGYGCLCADVMLPECELGAGGMGGNAVASIYWVYPGISGNCPFAEVAQNDFPGFMCSCRGLPSSTTVLGYTQVTCGLTMWQVEVALATVLLPPTPVLQSMSTRGSRKVVFIQIDQPGLGMPSREYYFNDGNYQKVSISLV